MAPLVTEVATPTLRCLLEAVQFLEICKGHLFLPGPVHYCRKRLAVVLMEQEELLTARRVLLGLVRRGSTSQKYLGRQVHRLRKEQALV